AIWPTSATARAERSTSIRTPRASEPTRRRTPISPANTGRRSSCPTRCNGRARPVASFRALTAALVLAQLAAAHEHVCFPTQDGGVVYAALYGRGERGLVLAHGAAFDKSSWEKQAPVFARAGFRVLAIDFRGKGQSRGPGESDLYTAPLHFDMLAAV